MLTGEETHKAQYGITSLGPEEASAERLLTIRRGHWTIENKSHWMRDTLLGEDASPVRCVLYHKSWQQCAKQHYLYSDSQE